jgi:hypothetical protein
MTQIVLRPVSPGASMSVIVDAIEHVAELARDSSAANVCFVTVNPDPLDVGQLQRDARTRPSKLGANSADGGAEPPRQLVE